MIQYAVGCCRFFLHLWKTVQSDALSSVWKPFRRVGEMRQLSVGIRLWTQCPCMYDSSSIPGFNCLYDHVIVNHVTLWHYTFWFSNAAQPIYLFIYYLLSQCWSRNYIHTRCISIVVRVLQHSYCSTQHREESPGIDRWLARLTDHHFLKFTTCSYA